MRVSTSTKIILVVLLIASLTACAASQGKRDLISRNWEVQANIVDGKAIKGGTAIEMNFKKDGTIEIKYNGVVALEGGWSLIENETKIQIDAGSGGQQSGSMIYTILELSSDKLRMLGGGAENVLVPK